MGIIIGIDVGGSTTKIVGMQKDRRLISTMMVKAYDQLTSLYGALGNYMDTNGIPLTDVERIYITGVGSSYLNGDIYGIPTNRVAEFSAIGKGGLWLSGLDSAIVISMGTGTAFVQAKDGVYRHIGGSGVGGGTLLGLGCRLTNADSFESFCRLAEKGSLKIVGKKVVDRAVEFVKHLCHFILVVVGNEQFQRIVGAVVYCAVFYVLTKSVRAALFGRICSASAFD